MDTSLLFLKIVALYFVVSGLFLLIKGKTSPFLLKDFFSHPAIVYLTGVILLFLGGGILIQGYAGTLETTTQILIVVLGWIVLFKGLAYIFMPNYLAKISLKKLNSWFGILGVAMILLGVYLFFF